MPSLLDRLYRRYAPGYFLLYVGFEMVSAFVVCAATVGLFSLYTEMDLEDALATMRAAGRHVARAFDADGRTLGVLFLEDILEELVGEVEDATRRR